VTANTINQSDSKYNSCPDSDICVEGDSKTASVGRKEPSPSSHLRCPHESPTHSKKFYNVKTI